MLSEMLQKTKTQQARKSIVLSSVAMPLRSGLMFGGVVPQVEGCWGGVRGCRNITAPNEKRYVHAEHLQTKTDIEDNSLITICCCNLPG